MFGYVASSGNTSLLENVLELSAVITADLGEPLMAARLAGAAETLRQESGMQISEPEAAMLEQFLAPAGRQAPHAMITAMGRPIPETA